MASDLRTRDQMLAAVRFAQKVFVQPRWGVSEYWVAITKKEATWLVNHLDEADTPRTFEMGTTVFGHLDDGDLYIG